MLRPIRRLRSGFLPDGLAVPHRFEYGGIMMSFNRRGPLASQIRSTLALALPVIGSNLTQSLKHLTDAVMLGWYGVDELAGGVLGGTLFTITFIVGSGCAMAALPLAAAAEGSGRTWRVRRVVRMGLWLSLIFGLLVLLPLQRTEQFLLLLGQEPLTAGLAGDYMRIAAWGLFPALTIMALKSFFMALVRPQVVLWSTLAGAVFNVFANYALIFGNWGFPELGIRGAAVATVVSHSFALLIMLAVLKLRPAFRQYSLFSNFLRPDWPILREVFRLGWPISATLVAETGFFSVTAIMMGWIDTQSLAAHGIALEITAFVFMIYLGLANAGTVMVGRAFGTADRTAIILASRAAIILCVLAVAATVLVLVSIPATLVTAFLDEDSGNVERVVEIGVALIYVAAAFQIGDALQVVALGLLRGLKDTRHPMIIAAISYAVIGVPSSYLLGFTFGGGATGVWVGFVIGLGTAAALLLFRFRLLVGRMAADSRP